MPSAADEAEKARRRAEVLALLRHNLQHELHRRQDDAFLQADAATYAAAAFYNAEAAREKRPAVRTFVCQGCGKASAILHGAGMKCGCGAWSAAEVLPP